MAAIYIANTQLLTAAGPTSYTNFCAYRAGINTYQFANYHTQDHHQIILSLVPDAALPPLIDELEDGDLRYRDERLIQLCAQAASALLDNYKGAPVPLIMAGPQNYPDFNNQLPSHFLHHLASQIQLPIDYSISRTLCTGRTGVLNAIDLGQHYLDSGQHDYVLVGGVDSCHHTDWLHQLDMDGRLKTERPTATGDTFVPGEGAAFLLLTNKPDLAMDYQGFRIKLSDPGFGEEEGHLYSDKAYRGQGLDQAVKKALSALPLNEKIETLFSSMNGEHFWAKEIGVALTRSSQRLHQVKHEHPADCFGDLGAATGGALIALAAHHATSQRSPSNTLICTSSDTEYRAAICVTPERISA